MIKPQNLVGVDRSVQFGLKTVEPIRKSQHALPAIESGGCRSLRLVRAKNSGADPQFTAYTAGNRTSFL